jgi:hypothetical protein
MATIVCLVMFATPAAMGAKPTRTTATPEDQFLPAGFACSFDVLETAGEDGEGRLMITEFSDGRTQIIGHGTAHLINLETEASIDRKARAKITETYDPATNDVFVNISGRLFIQFFPGDQGPFGEVQSPGALLGLIGHFQYTFDLDSFLITSFSLDGTATDLCAQLSE